MLDQERVDLGMVDVSYKSLVGSLMYLAVCTYKLFRKYYVVGIPKIKQLFETAPL